MGVLYAQDSWRLWSRHLDLGEKILSPYEADPPSGSVNHLHSCSGQSRARQHLGPPGLSLAQQGHLGLPISLLKPHLWPSLWILLTWPLSPAGSMQAKCHGNYGSTAILFHQQVWFSCIQNCAALSGGFFFIRSHASEPTQLRVHSPSDLMR